MKKNYKAKLQGEFDIIQLAEDNYDEVVAFIARKDENAVFDKTFCDRSTPYIEFIQDAGMKCVELGDYVFTTPDSTLHIMSKERFESTYEEI